MFTTPINLEIIKKRGAQPHWTQVRPNTYTLNTS